MSPKRVSLGLALTLCCLGCDFFTGEDESSESSAGAVVPGGTGGGSPVEAGSDASSEQGQDAPELSLFPVTLPLGEGGSSGAGGTGQGGSAGCAGSGTSVTCGDGIRDLVTEECDDGLGSLAETRGCSASCVVVDHLPGSAAVEGDRLLGLARHPVAAAWHGQAAALVETETAASPRISVSTWSPVGRFLGASVIGDALFDAAPVVAPLAAGGFALAYTALGADGDGLGIALAIVPAGGGAVVEASHANQTAYFAQHTPDIVLVGDQIAVGWEDDSPADARTVCYRLFSQQLSPIGSETCEPSSGAWRSHIVLADNGGDLVRAWREENGETGNVMVARGTTQVAFPLFPGNPDAGLTNGALPAADEAPALASTPGGDVLLIHAFGDGRLFAAALSPGLSVLLSPSFLNETGSPRFNPALATTSDGIYFAWRQPEASDPSMSDLFIQRLLWNGEVLDTATYPAIRLPRQSSHQAGDQTAPALAGACAGLIAAWNDHTPDNFTGESTHGDVAIELIPTPILRVGDP